MHLLDSLIELSCNMRASSHMHEGREVFGTLGVIL